jgi:hypothetical protein
MFLVLPQIVPFNIGEDKMNFGDSVMAACAANFLIFLLVARQNLFF